MLGKRFWGVALSLALLLMMVAPAFAGDRAVSITDLKKVTPRKHRYIFSVIGGTLLGAGIGELIGGGHGNIMKGMLIGGGGLSAIYLHSHHAAGNGYRDWDFLASHSALGLGAGWTICGCTRGAVFGLLAGAGGDLIWRSLAPHKGFHQVAQMGKNEATKVKNGTENAIDTVTNNGNNNGNNDQNNGNATQNQAPPQQR